jgi:hypothetical protein
VSAPVVWRGHCFGLAVESRVTFAGCAPGPAGDGRPLVRVELGTRDAVRSAVPRAASEVIARLQTAPGHWREHVRAHPDRGYVLTSPGRGVFHLDPGGARVVAAPARITAWRWQRALGGEVLPFAAALRGLETLHASGVVLPDGGAAIAVSGASGRGKTSVAADLVVAGCEFLADDVVAVNEHAGAVVAHPGMALMSLRAVTVERLGEGAVRGLGSVVGRDSRGLRIAVRRHDSPVRLAALYLLVVDSRVRRPALERITAPDPATVLGTTFNLALQTPARLLAQLDAAAAMAARVRIVRVELPPVCDHAEVAARILADARGAA